MKRIPSSEITPESVYLSRRQFLKKSLLAAGAVALAACVPSPGVSPTQTPTAMDLGITDEYGTPATPKSDILNYNNFYEFTPSKSGVAKAAEGWITSPWQVHVGGLVNKPATYDFDDLRRMFQIEERIYRLRCVETWSMVIPWNGFPLAALLDLVEPTSNARYVRFESVFDPDNLVGQRQAPGYPWPYVEGLRLDEAYHPLTLLATGIYGSDLAPQSGAPIRLVVPWKYGFKSIKSIVKIDLVEDMPVSFWTALSPDEYGFYANVNPEVSHPRWSQAREIPYGASTALPTRMFNGYGQDVASLYADQDLRLDY